MFVVQLQIKCYYTIEYVHQLEQTQIQKTQCSEFSWSQSSWEEPLNARAEVELLPARASIAFVRNTTLYVC